jgi:hypothetical protein
MTQLRNSSNLISAVSQSQRKMIPPRVARPSCSEDYALVSDRLGSVVTPCLGCNLLQAICLTRSDFGIEYLMAVWERGQFCVRLQTSVNVVESG